jgi:hypothetical protein
MLRGSGPRAVVQPVPAEVIADHLPERAFGVLPSHFAVPRKRQPSGVVLGSLDVVLAVGVVPCGSHAPEGF